jgi:hypothetical protein
MGGASGKRFFVYNLQVVDPPIQFASRFRRECNFFMTNLGPIYAIVVYGNLEFVCSASAQKEWNGPREVA